MTAAATLPALLRRNAERFARRVAVREKRHGVWQELTWADYAARVERLALGLRDLGLAESETIAILTDNRHEWLYAELAAQVLRGHRVAAGMRLMVAPASLHDQQQAEQEGVMGVLRDAGGCRRT